MIDGNTVKAGERISCPGFDRSSTYGRVHATSARYAVVQWDGVVQTDVIALNSPLWEHVDRVTIR